jgi:Putative effector of murein hydrolase
MKDVIFTSEPFMLMLVIGSFLLGTYIYRKTKFVLFHPCLIAMIIIIAFLVTFDISYEAFSKGSRIIHFLLGPAVVALGVVLYEQSEYLKQNIISMFTAITVGSFIGVGSVILIGKMMGVDAQMIFSLEPKSVTTPIAISLSNANGGLPAVTAVTVVVCGIMALFSDLKFSN